MKDLNGHGMSSMARKLLVPATISLVLVLPFMIMELVNRRGLPQDFPVPLFGLMWLLTLSFILILMPLVRNLREGNGNLINQLTLLPKLVLLIIIAGLWVVLTVDQMPCFLGVPNCD